LKKILKLLVILLLTVLIFAGCADQASEIVEVEKPGEIDFPTRPITLIVSFSAGGGTDVGARLLIPYVEKELGVNINVVNKPGGSGWVGWTELLSAKPDGYTIGYINTPNLLVGYLDPQFNRDENIDSFALISNHVVDYGAISISPKETRFTNAKELFEYAKINEVTATTTGAGGDEHIAMLMLNNKYGTKFVPLHTAGAAEGRAAILGGHVDVYFANVGEVRDMHNDKEVITVAVMAPERSQFLPDVTTIKEIGYDVSSWSARGLAAPAGIDQAVLDKLIAAFDKGLSNPEHLAEMENLGLAVKPMKGDEYRNFLLEDEKNVIGVSELLGF